MMKYQRRPFELTPQLVKPTLLKVQWTLHLISWRDHALWRSDVTEGVQETRVGLAMGPCPGPQERSTLIEWVGHQMGYDVATAVDYLADPPSPFQEGA